MPFKIVISLTLGNIKMFLNLISFPKSPSPNNIKVTHNTAHVTISNKQKEHIINQS